MEHLDAPTEPTPRRPGRVAFGLIGILLFAGIVLTSLLVREHARIELGAQEEGILCGTLGGSCREALLSSDAYLMGVPVAYFGLGWYVGLALLAACAWAVPVGREGWPSSGWTGAFCVAGILGMFPAVYFTLRMFTSTYGYCELCLFSHGVATLLFLTTLIVHVFVGVRHSASVHGTDEAEMGDGLAHPANIPARLGVALALVTGFSVVLMLTLTREARTSARLATTIDDLKRDIPGVRERLTIEGALSVTSAEVTEMIAQNPPPIYGSAEAGVPIRIFIDVSCSKCADAFTDMQRIATENSGKVRLEVFFFPYESTCNPYTPLARGRPFVCEATKAVIAARNQDAAKPMLEYILSRQPYLAQASWKQWGEEIGLDGDRLVADMASEETTRYLQRDLDLGNKVPIEGTPTIIVGTQVLKASARPEDLFGLISAEMVRLYGPAVPSED